MKRLLLVCIALFTISTSFASVEIKNPPTKAAEIFLQIGTNGQKISLKQLSVISVRDYEVLSGRHMKFFERLSFKSSQKKLKNGIAKDGTIKNKKLVEAIGDDDPSTGFHLGGFALGLFLPIIGILIAYLIGGDEDIRKNRVKYALRGTAITLAIFGVIAALAANSVY